LVSGVRRPCRADAGPDIRAGHGSTTESTRISDHVGVAAEISAREAEVLAALGAHRSNAQIAHALHISVRTVESHVSSLLRKYDVADRRALADLAGSTGTAAGLTGVPASGTTFVGREQEIATVTAAVSGGARLVTLLGPGGMGKTRLAAVVAGAVADGFPAGGAFVDLVPVRAGSVEHAVATALGVTERPPQSLRQLLLERLRAGRRLLVLDNCEHVLDEIGELTGQVLAGCPQATVLATSRERLAVPGEHTVAVPPLSADAERLFADRARAVDPGFAADGAEIAELCARLDGMPLAIELAAARIGSLGLDGLRTALDDRLRLLSGGRGSDPRHRSLREVIGWSVELLSDEERVLLRRLSVFAGGFDLAAAGATSPELSRSAVADLVGRLVDKSLVVRYRDRWRLLDTIRAFAAEQLDVAGERDALTGRHLAWAADTAAELERRIGGDWRDEFDQVHDDLRAALAASPAGPDPVAHRLARALAHLTFARRDLVEARRHYRTAADRAEHPTAAAQDLRTAADAAVAVADSLTAYELLLEATECGGERLRPALLALTVILVNRYPAGALYDLPAERTAAMLTEAGDDHPDPRTAALLAAARAWQYGDPRVDADEDLSRDAVAAARRTGDPVLIAAALDALGTAVGSAGRMREAYEYSRERMRLVESLPAHEPYAAAEIIDAFHVMSRDAISTGALPEALAIAELTATADPTGDHPYIVLPRRIRVDALTGRFDEAISQADALWEGWTGAGSPPMEWMSSAVAAAALVHGLRADGSYGRWRDRAATMARTDDPARSVVLRPSAAFAAARVAVHVGTEDAAGLVAAAFAHFKEFWWGPYARAAGAELAVVAGLADAADRLAAAAPVAAENDWAAACLARAEGRLRSDAGLIEQALAGFERIGARFERAATMLLLPARAAEAKAELDALGCPVTGTVHAR
jgi:predicted ATPase/DNA-binding CsgD family transcriptional regulator